MLAQMIRFFKPTTEQQRAALLYHNIVQQARQPWFYADAGVPDTLDGRFELVLVHMFLALERLKQEADTAELQRCLIEMFFDDMDRSVREIGVSDTGVGRRVKAMANALYGRLDAYRKAMEDEQALREAIRRNLYGTVKEQVADGAAVTTYIMHAHRDLSAKPVDDAFPDFAMIDQGL